MNMCLLEVAMYEKCRSSDFQSERGSKKFKYCRRRGGRKLFGMEVGYQFGSLCGKAAGGSVPHYMQCNFHLPINPFIVQNLKILTADPELWQCAISWPNIDHLPPIFFLKIIIILIYLLAPFIVQNLKKLLPADPELWGYVILGPTTTHFPNEIFFRKPVNEPCFFHSCLSTYQKVNSDINLLVKYW